MNIVRCLDALLDAEPEAITPDWIQNAHPQLAGGLLPDWAGGFRNTDVWAVSHIPPTAHTVAVRANDLCLDLAERLCHESDAESFAGLVAWVDWRFPWIFPFNDFNGRGGRILLVALAYKLGLPLMDPADVADKEA